jgi:sigma-B regulation protein RsbU (phosphoserine phosphatase)
MIKIDPGDTLILYTDGVTEAVNADLDEFGTDRLYWTAQSLHGLQPQAVVDGIRDAVHEHIGDAPQFDDVAFVVLKRNEK